MSRALRTFMIAGATAAILTAVAVIMAFVPESSEAAPEEQPRREEPIPPDSQSPEELVPFPVYDPEEAGREERETFGIRRVTPEENAEQDRQYEQRQARRRALRRFSWEAPAETRARLWNVPETEHDEATATAFLRVCISEAAGAENDCLSIWQVFKNTRSRTCNRHLTKITECNESGETLLSVMRRHSGRVLGVVAPRTRRSEWISNLTLSCERPEAWPSTQAAWDRLYASRLCPRVAALARRLVSGDTDGMQWPIHGSRAIAWGGACELEGGACDDDVACLRGLIRVQGTQTLNAFWRRPLYAGEIEPVCAARGFGTEEQRQTALREQRARRVRGG